jgi:hypothetical protein
MVVDVRLVGVVALLVLLRVLVCMGQRGVIVLVRMPGRPVIPLTNEHCIAVMVGDVIVVVRVDDLLVSVTGMLISGFARWYACDHDPPPLCSRQRRSAGVAPASRKRGEAYKPETLCGPPPSTAAHLHCPAGD